MLKVIQFNQEAWLKEYIDMDTKLKIDFEKDFLILKKNSVFGKTMENVRKHGDIKLASRDETILRQKNLVPWCRGYHCCTTSFNKAWTHVLHRFKSCSRRVRDSRWWGSLTMFPVGNKAKRLSSVNHTTKTIQTTRNQLMSEPNYHTKKWFSENF